jgi:predicted enzyme related to lactoylglutathione lyase
MPVPLVRLILYVQDVERLKSFYAENFDLPVVEEIKDEWVVFKAGAIELALHLVGERYRKGAEDGQGERPAEWPSSPKKAGSNTKFVFAIESNLPAHREKLLAAGVKVGALKRYEGFPYEMYDGYDPEGNIFQVMLFD